MNYEIQYRLLNEEEKKIFYKEFITFLSVQGIDADLWKEIRIKEKEKAFLLFAQFSDLVIQRSLENMQFLTKQTEKETEIIFADKKWMHILKMPIKSLDIDELKKQAKQLFKIFRTKTTYPSMGREKWIFRMIEQQGFQPSKKDFNPLFDTI